MTNGRVLAACALLGAVAFAEAPAHEHGAGKQAQGMRDEAAGPSIRVPWARASRGRTSAVYFSLVGGGNRDDRLIAAACEVARRAEIHTHIEENGVYRMRKVDGVDVPAGRTVEFRPGGYHVMLMGLRRPLEKGERFDLDLVFEKAGKRTARVVVQAAGAMKGGHH